MKKFTAILLALLMLLSCGAVTAFAENGPSEAQWSEDQYFAYIIVFKNSEDGGLYRIFSNNTANNEAVEGATYSRDTNTLTLENVVMPDFGLETNMMGDDFKLEIKGECELGRISVLGDGYGGSLSIIGDGTLTVNKEKTADNAIALYPENADVKLVFGESVKLNLSAKNDVIEVYRANGDDAASAFEFNDGKSYSVKVEQAAFDEQKSVCGYYYQEPMEGDKDWLGIRTTKKDEPDGVYIARAYLDDDFEETGEYGIERFVYSEKYGMYLQDLDFEELVLTADQMEEQGFEIKFEEKPSETPEYLSNPVYTNRVQCKVYTDADDNVYYMWYMGDVVDELQGAVLNGEPVKGFDGEYIFTVNDDVEPDTLTETESKVNGYYLSEPEDEEGQWLGEKAVNESDPDGIYVVNRWYRTDDYDNITERGVSVYKYIYNETLGFYMHDTSYSDDENNIYGKRDMSEEAFQESGINVIYPIEKSYEYLYNPAYRRSSYGRIFRVCADSEGKEYVVESEYTEDDFKQVVLDMNEIEELENVYWLTLNESVNPDDLTVVTEHTVLDGLYNYIIEGEELVYSPETQTQPTETKATEPAETEATQPTETKATEPAETEATQPTETKATEPAETEAPKPVQKDIKKCSVSGIKAKTYTGKALTQSVTVKDGSKKLVKDKDYTVSYKNNKNAGVATVTIKGKGGYKGTVSKTFNIGKAQNPMTVAYKKSVSAVSKRATTINSAVVVKKAQGNVTYTTNNKKAVVKNGKLVIFKGLKKGKTYTLKVTVTAKGNSNYLKQQKTVKIKIKVK